MTRPIVVGVHPARSEREPVELAVMLSCMTQAPLEVVGTYWFDSTPARSAPRDFRAKWQQEIEDALADGVDTSGACSEVRVSARAGSAAHILHETARTVDAGLIVVGSTHRKSVGRMTLGSTLDRVLEGAPCPVAVVPRGCDPRRAITRVGVAFVDTPEGRAALRAGAQLARHADAGLIAYTALGAGSAVAPQEAEAALERALGAYADDLTAEARVLVDGGAAALVDASREVDLLVTGSRGHGPLRATMLGGMSRKLAKDARCPLIVIPRGTEEPLSALLDQSAPAFA